MDAAKAIPPLLILNPSELSPYPVGLLLSKLIPITKITKGSKISYTTKR